MPCHAALIHQVSIGIWVALLAHHHQYSHHMCAGLSRALGATCRAPARWESSDGGGWAAGGSSLRYCSTRGALLDAAVIVGAVCVVCGGVLRMGLARECIRGGEVLCGLLMPGCVVRSPPPWACDRVGPPPL